MPTRSARGGGGQQLVLVGALPPKHIRGLSFSFF